MQLCKKNSFNAVVENRQAAKSLNCYLRFIVSVV